MAASDKKKIVKKKLASFFVKTLNGTTTVWLNVRQLAMKQIEQIPTMQSVNMIQIGLRKTYEKMNLSSFKYNTAKSE